MLKKGNCRSMSFFHLAHRLKVCCVTIDGKGCNIEMSVRDSDVLHLLYLGLWSGARVRFSRISHYSCCVLVSSLLVLRSRLVANVIFG